MVLLWKCLSRKIRSLTQWFIMLAGTISILILFLGLQILKGTAIGATENAVIESARDSGVLVLGFFRHSHGNEWSSRTHERPAAPPIVEVRSSALTATFKTPIYHLVIPYPVDNSFNLACWGHPDTNIRQENPHEVESMVERSCQPHTHIFFLKTHKTASSTIMNILFRFGESHNLTFALPHRNLTQFYYPYDFRAEFVEGFITRIRPSYDIMCHHMRFQLAEVEKIMPRDTFYFTILRNPVSLMESSFSYYKAIDIFKNTGSLEDYLKNPYRYYNKTSLSRGYGKNLMAYDLGFDIMDTDTPKYLKLAQKTIETEFDLVLITEYFDESLILLKNALCWSFDDILSFPLNNRNATSRKVLSGETQEQIKTWNQLDWQLYVYFNKSFWERVDNFGRDRMQSEVQELRKRRAAQSEICLLGQVDPVNMSDKHLQPFQAGISRILGYNLKPGLQAAERLLCQQLVTPEIQYTAKLSTKQYQKERSRIARYINYRRHHNIRKFQITTKKKKGVRSM